MWGKLHIPLLCAVGTLYSFVAGVRFNTLTRDITLQRLATVQKGDNWLVLSMFLVTAVEDIVITAALCHRLRKERDRLYPRLVRVLLSVLPSSELCSKDGASVRQIGNMDYW